MNSIGRHCNFNETYYDDETCHKISLAIKKSKIFAHINPMDLLKEKMGINNTDENVYDSLPPLKKLKIQNPRKLGSPLKCTSAGNITLLPTPVTFIPNHEFVSSSVVLYNQSTISNENSLKSIENNVSHCIVTPKSPLNINQRILPPPESFFEDEISKSINTETMPQISSSSNEQLNNFNEEYLRTKNIILEKFADANKNKANIINQVPIADKNVRNDKVREKQNKNLYSLATSLLPVPSQLYDKESLVIALNNGDISGFIELFKEGIKLTDELSSDDLCEIVDTIIKRNALCILPEFCNCLEFSSCFSEVLSNCFIKYNVQMKNYQENVLNCLSTMIDIENSSTMLSFIKACFCVNDWNKMWSSVLSKDPGYKFEEKYFKACMDIFQNLNNSAVVITHDTMLIIINYIMRHYCENYEMYMADIWLYCVLTTDINADTDLKVPQKIQDKVIEKLIVMKNPSFLFIMKLLSKNWGLLFNATFSVWLSQMISDKNDVKQCLLSLKESIESSSEHDIELSNSFLLLALNVMSCMNKRSLITCSKKIYETFIENKLDHLKHFLKSRSDKFKYKWIIVDCLISSIEYQKALMILKDFDVLRDLETTCAEYNSVRDLLPNLVWHLLSISHITPIIDLFEQVMSIFLFNEKNDGLYLKNCSEIFHLIIVKVFESNNIDIVKRMLLLLEQILSSEIEFHISKDSLRYLLVAAVRTEVPFNELLDITDQCFKFEVFENIQTTEDGFGSFVNACSSLTVEEVTVLISWLCRQVKIKLVELAQSEGPSVRGNLMKVCNVKFMLRPTKIADEFSKKIGSSSLFKDLLGKFTESLSSPKYLSHPIKFTANNDSHDLITICCDNRIVYNAIYYSDI